MKLSDLPLHQPAIIVSIDTPVEQKRALCQHGILPGETITPLFSAKNITAYRIRGAVLAMRHTDTANILVRKEQTDETHR